jgi:hypothetical protein
LNEKFLNWENPPWAEIKALAKECGIFEDNYGDPMCGDWGDIRLFAYRVAEITAAPPTEGK